MRRRAITLLAIIILGALWGLAVGWWLLAVLTRRQMASTSSGRAPTEPDYMRAWRHASGG